MNRCCKCDKVAEVKHQFKHPNAKHHKKVWYCYTCYELKYPTFTKCCKCNGCADHNAEVKNNWYCYDCYRIKFCTTDKVKKYRPWVTWNFTPVDDKPFG